MKQQLVRQVELSLRPCITIYRNPHGSILLKNIGHGPALQVSTFPIKTASNIFEFEYFPLLEAGEAGLSFNVTLYKNTPKKEKITNAATIWDTGEEATFEVRYFNMEGIEYYSKIRMNKAGSMISLIKTGRIN